ncbi:hypothetical protein ACFXDH_50155 [Streptomyces sp. NPDC059467]|uniref:hypothetical protein n=1 Tax=Streptomyces sp. NPDC059467 TaxID=3346844 RepID=UPI0036779905
MNLTEENDLLQELVKLVLEGALALLRRPQHRRWLGRHPAVGRQHPPPHSRFVPYLVRHGPKRQEFPAQSLPLTPASS